MAIERDEIRMKMRRRTKLDRNNQLSHSLSSRLEVGCMFMRAISVRMYLCVCKHLVCKCIHIRRPMHNVTYGATDLCRLYGQRCQTFHHIFVSFSCKWETRKNILFTLYHSYFYSLSPTPV